VQLVCNWVTATDDYGVEVRGCDMVTCGLFSRIISAGALEIVMLFKVPFYLYLYTIPERLPSSVTLSPVADPRFWTIVEVQ